jgi:hypothetical protein
LNWTRKHNFRLIPGGTDRLHLAEDTMGKAELVANVPAAFRDFLLLWTLSILVSSFHVDVYILNGIYHVVRLKVKMVKMQRKVQRSYRELGRFMQLGQQLLN